ncbi:hypothetical protein GXW78_07580 [Roseomonas terrae]|uniref:Uncharacterized protein n=1 Tax=Neoroseomonas terrae TaxID=424799 RepID=A0ABS5EER1_9PROT|nr:hypothetical protein [Neoroseomonas terrae]MBR0649515.1 hypothetical protein [Neoroseomonas terrae]
MTLQFGATLRNNQANQLESTVGTSPKLQIRTGAPPADCAAADIGTLLCEITLPSDWMGAASGGVVAKSGTWQGTAGAGGTAGHWRLKDSAGTTTHAQGTITGTGGGGDMTLDNTSIANAQTVTISSFSYTRGNA